MKIFYEKMTYDKAKELFKEDVFTMKEIIPNSVMTVKFNKEFGGNNTEATLFKLLIPINENNILVFANEDVSETSTKSLTESFTENNLFTFPEIGLENLNISSLSESFQKLTEDVKTKFQNLFNK